MSWERPFDLFLDVRKPGAASSLLIRQSNSFAESSTPIRWIEGDCFPLRIHLLDPETQTFTEIESPVAILAGKASAAMDDGSTLFSAQDFSAVVPGEGMHAIEAVLDLNTEGLISAISASTISGSPKFVLAQVDLELQNADNTRRQTYRFPVEVQRQAYKDSDLDPTPGPPTYPPPSAIVANLSGSVDVDAEVADMEVDISEHGLEEAPSVVLPSICKPSADAPQIICTGVSGVTAEGFIAHLSGITPTAGYKLNYLVIP
jgi:hypothetical protein